MAMKIGEKGLQASTVEVIQKPGRAEGHDELHDLPSVATPLRVRKKKQGTA